MAFERSSRGMIFTLFKIKFNISVPFAVVLSFLLITDQTGFMSASVLAVSVHEIGHLAAMYFTNALPESISFGFGGIEIISRSFTSFSKSLAVCISGPLANMVFFFIFYAVGKTADSYLVFCFAAVQLLVGAINLMPIRGLDGGDLLKYILSATVKCNPEFVLRWVSIIFSCAVLVLGVMVSVKNVSNPSLLLLGIYLIMLNIFRYDTQIC